MSTGSLACTCAAPRARVGTTTRSRSTRAASLSCRAPLLHAREVWRLKCPKGEHHLVFPNDVGNPMDAANLIHRGFGPAVRAGLRKVRFHNLRHTAASLLPANVSTWLPSRVSSATARPWSRSRSTRTRFFGSAKASRTSFQDFLVANRVADWSANDQRYSDDERTLLNELVGRAGVEPATNGLKVQCSTN